MKIVLRVVHKLPCLGRGGFTITPTLQKDNKGRGSKIANFETIEFMEELDWSEFLWLKILLVLMLFFPPKFFIIKSTGKCIILFKNSLL